MDDQELEQAITEFTGAFEVVFGQDWQYSRGMLKEEFPIAPGATFIEPDVPIHACNWGARAALLESYQRLLSVMANRKLKPQLPVPDTWFHYDWPDSK